jgi:hypothetical protein
VHRICNCLPALYVLFYSKLNFSSAWTFYLSLKVDDHVIGNRMKFLEKLTCGSNFWRFWIPQSEKSWFTVGIKKLLAGVFGKDGSCDAGKSHKLVTFWIHFVSVGVFTGEFKFDMGCIDGPISGGVLPDIKINGGG